MNNKIKPVVKLMMLGITLGVMIMFVVFIKGTDLVASQSYFGLAAVTLLGCTFFSAVTCGKLYDYFKVKRPLLRFVPCLGELSLIDFRFRRVGLMLYAAAAVVGVVLYLNVLPGVSTPFYVALVLLALLASIQVVKGIGLRAAYMELEQDWVKISGHSAGALKLFILFGYLPFIRIYLVYSINKILMTLVTFGGFDYADADSERNALDVSEDK